MVQITWIGQASFLLASGTTRIAVDLFLTATAGAKEPWMTLPDLDPLDAALVTHEHIDHFDQPLLEQIHATMPALSLIVPEPLEHAAQALGFRDQRLYLARPGQDLALGDFTVTPVLSAHGVHANGGYGLGDPPGRFLGYVIRAPGVTVYHSGDTILYPGMIEDLAQHRIDVAMLPINGRDYFRESRDIVGNLTAEESVELAVQIGARTLVPMHYDAFWGNLGRVEAAVRYARERHPWLNVVVLGYGNPILLGHDQAFRATRTLADLVCRNFDTKEQR
ncbi:MBL fold metallo-hydrolase [Sulfobacillus harzensis]|uniref:MBL fold metallo-hydrolase n=1 Tax=Sulfobacillus harzensis TaxID=2729629 RepID=A0A7Y0L3Z6_9FIRM|nr:MBL fold metallo-hydrolase [Sulfobacillus harzensis]NMP22810.1 MBL fold metallo-hydrolase [Sulfobacillus harzensis]